MFNECFTFTHYLQYTYVKTTLTTLPIKSTPYVGRGHGVLFSSLPSTEKQYHVGRFKDIQIVNFEIKNYNQSYIESIIKNSKTSD